MSKLKCPFSTFKNKNKSKLTHTSVAMIRRKSNRKMRKNVG